MDWIMKDGRLEAGEKTLFVMAQYDPSFANDIVHHAILDEGFRKPVGIMLSKFLSETTLNVLPNPDKVGCELYQVERGVYYLTIPRWQKLKPSEPTADWIYLYPICKGICDWANNNGFTEVISISANSIHHFLEGGDYAELNHRRIYTWEHPKTLYRPKGSWGSNVPKGDVLFTPMEYNLPLIFSETTPMGAKGLSVFTGSNGLAGVNTTSASTLIRYINNKVKALTNIHSTISPQAVENAKSVVSRQFAEESDQDFIRVGDKPSNANGSVMFG